MGEGKVGHTDFFKNRASNASKHFLRGFPFLPKKKKMELSGYLTFRFTVEY